MVKNVKKTKKINPTKKIMNAVNDPKIFAEVGKTQVRGFFEFIRSQGVVGLAVGLVLGGAVSVIVKSLVDNVIMPPLGFLLGSAEGLKGLSLTMGKADGQIATLNYGIFLNDFVNFFIIAIVVYFIVKLLHVEKIDIKKVQK